MGLRDTCVLMRAEDIPEGARVCFEVPMSSYLVEVSDTSPIGMVRHRYADETGSASYWPGEQLYVDRESLREVRHG